MNDSGPDTSSSIHEEGYFADAVIGAGRGALILAMFGAGWIGWGLSEARLFNRFTGPALGFTELFLVACSIYVIRKGRLLRKKHPAMSARQPILRPFLLVVLVEILALVLVALIANRLHRSDLASDWFAMVVGLHYLPLAKIFRAPILGVLGLLMAIWCAICWALFRGNALVISVSFGTGILLWAASASALLHARQFAHQPRT